MKEQNSSIQYRTVPYKEFGMTKILFPYYITFLHERYVREVYFSILKNPTDSGETIELFLLILLVPSYRSIYDRFLTDLCRSQYNNIARILIIEDTLYILVPVQRVA